MEKILSGLDIVPFSGHQRQDLWKHIKAISQLIDTPDEFTWGDTAEQTMIGLIRKREHSYRLSLARKWDKSFLYEHGVAVMGELQHLEWKRNMGQLMTTRQERYLREKLAPMIEQHTAKLLKLENPHRRK